MQLLKVAVIVMGAMIVVGIGILGYTIVSRSSKMISQDAAPTAPAPIEANDPLPAGFASSALGLPAGSRVQTMSVENRRLILVVDVPEAGERVIIVDLETGARLGAIHLEAAP
jgi:hypothetical protein